MTTYRGVEYMEVGGQPHAPAVLTPERGSDNRWLGRWLGSRAMWTLWRVQAMECYSCKFSGPGLCQWVSAAKTTLLCGNCICYRPRVTTQGTIYSATSETKSYTKICGNKMPTRCNRWFLLQILLLAQHVSGTTMPIIRSSRVLYRWLLPVVFGALVFKLSVWCGDEGYVLQPANRKTNPQLHTIPTTWTPKQNTTGSNHPYNTIELLMMGIVVPETCWASNKICNKIICCI